MPDIMSKQERSKRMSLIKGQWTKPEKWLHNYLRGWKVPHKMHPKMEGAPDVILPIEKIAVFIHGCFWHGCKKCYKAPVNHAKFWRAKVLANIRRDGKNVRLLKNRGWNVKIIWEHEIPRYGTKETVRNLIKAKLLK